VIAGIISAITTMHGLSVRDVKPDFRLGAAPRTLAPRILRAFGNHMFVER
jgi:hypothetical protein